MPTNRIKSFYDALEEKKSKPMPIIAQPPAAPISRPIYDNPPREHSAWLETFGRLLALIIVLYCAAPIPMAFIIWNMSCKIQDLKDTIHLLLH